MFHVKHLTVRQARQVRQYSGETGAAVVRYSGSTGEVRRSGGVRWYQVAQVAQVAQVRHIAVGAPL